MARYLVRIVRPVFQAAYLEVEGEDECDACGEADLRAYDLPEEAWRGRYNPDEHPLDAHCVEVGETVSGNPVSLIDFPLYTVLNTETGSPYPFTEGSEPWMDEVLNPLLVPIKMSQWIDQMVKARDGYYQRAIELCEELLRDMKGTGQKIVPLQPPAQRRDEIELLESTAQCLRLLRELD